MLVLRPWALLSVCALLVFPALAAGQSFYTPPSTPIPVPAPFQYHLFSDLTNVRPFSADMNTDGIQDLVLTDGGGIAIWLGLPAGGYGTLHFSPVGITAIRETLDVDGDGNLDFLAVNSNGEGVVLYGLGGGTVFAGPPAALSGGGFWDLGLCFVDLDQDGMPEIVGSMPGATWWPAPTSSVIGFWKLVAGTWNLVHQITVPYVIDEIVGGDFNGDGWQDLCFNGVTSPAIPWDTYAWINDQTTGYNFAQQGPLGLSERLFAIADLNRDGYDDVVVGRNATAHIAVRMGSVNGLSPPLSPSPISVGSTAENLGYGYQPIPLLEDVNDDGLVDLVWSTRTFNQSNGTNIVELRVVLGRGNGTFVGLVNYDYQHPLNAMSLGASGTAGVGDLDQDGDLDFIIVHETPGSGFPLPSVSELILRMNESILSPGSPALFGPLEFVADSLVPGSTTYSLDLRNALPGQTAILAVSWASASLGTAPAIIAIDPTQLLLPAAGIGLLTTDALGQASLPVPLPSLTLPGVPGLTLYAQWAVEDPLASIVLGNAGYALSPARKLVVW